MSRPNRLKFDTSARPNRIDIDTAKTAQNRWRTDPTDAWKQVNDALDAAKELARWLESERSEVPEAS